MEPALPEPAWQVFTNNQISRGMIATGAPQWAWVAYGPRGSQSGVEARAEDAMNKAQCAAVVLAEPRFERGATAA